MIPGDAWRVRRLSVPSALERPNLCRSQQGCSTGAAHAALARLPDVLRFTRTAKRSGSASGASVGWAKFTLFMPANHLLQRSHMAQASESACCAEGLARRLPGADAI
jgi:hypothetical protein